MSEMGETRPSNRIGPKYVSNQPKADAGSEGYRLENGNEINE